MPGRRGNSGLKVLVVDDSDSVRSIVRSHLACLAVSDIAEASNGQEALAVAFWFQPDIILVDWNMPVMNGLEFVTKFRQRDRATPVLMVTTEREKDRVVEAIRAGISGYLTKPFGRERLLDVLRDTITPGKKAA